MNILVVEDDPNLLGLWGRTLGREGHRTVLADTEAAALAALGDRRFDLVLLDLFCRNGLASGVIGMAATRSPDCKVVVVCGTAGTCGTDLFALSPNVAAVLSKPVDIEDLLAVCEAVGRGQRPLRVPTPENWAIEFRS
ncbi:response regulator [Tropicimonas sp. IMCC34043]|uniref:response regulator n=1 Tax=Tropicimonas sp. IMCC34043 TaxID=2248760 RepID=UPI000E259607|nr:response regulator [Tropicimonas sp. IMCC34043]